MFVFGVDSNDRSPHFVDDINVIRPGPMRRQVQGQKEAGKKPLTQLGMADYRYSIANTDAVPTYHLVLYVPVPYSSVVSPTGWN